MAKDMARLMPIKSAGQILVDEIRQAVDGLKNSVTPIFDVNQRGEAELLGSAVLIAISGQTFLCTANHVIEKNSTSTLYIDGPLQLEILEGDFQVSREHDVAVLKLQPEHLKIFEKYTPLPSECIAVSPEAETCKYAELIGFPETKNRKVYQQNKIKGLIYSLGCMLAKVTPTRVHVDFNKKRNIDTESRKRVSAPDPHGMSGGAILGVPVNARTIEGQPRPKLIGIMTDCPDGKNEIYGPSMAIVMAIIRDAYKTDLPTSLDPDNLHAKNSRPSRV
jgi:hypothetical protein